MENSNKPAFSLTDGQTFANDGLTKREYFAGLAMQGILAATSNSFSSKQVIEDAITCADTLLCQLEK